MNTGPTIDRKLWDGARVLLTGHTGFKGAWLSLWLEHLGAKVFGFALAPEHEKCVANLARCGGDRSIIGDIRQASAVNEAVTAAAPDIVLHMAAQPLVRLGFREPVTTFDTNLMGTANLLDALYRHHQPRCVLVITSDKVYANDGTTGAFSEQARLGGKEPYGASKACQEIITTAYAESYLRPAGIPVATARSGNVVGGGDWAADRLVGDVVRALEENGCVRLRNPASTRPWQHVLDPLFGYILFVQQLLTGDAPETLNFGPRTSHSVAVVAEELAGLLGVRVERESVMPDREPQAREAITLDVDPTAALHELGWTTQIDLKTTLRWIADWHLQHRHGADMRQVTLNQITAYEERLGQ